MAGWFINQADAGSNFSTHLAQLLGVAGQTGGFTTGLAATATTAVIAIVLGLLAFLGSVIQIMLMLVRGGMLVLLVGTLPLIAAFSNTEMGPSGFARRPRGCSRSRSTSPPRRSSTPSPSSSAASRELWRCWTA